MTDSPSTPPNNSSRPQIRWATPTLDRALIHPSDRVPDALANEIAGRLRRYGVDRMVLLHGTFVGNDAAGIFRMIGRFIPSLATMAAEQAKQWVDTQLGEVGNYTEAFQSELTSILNPPSGSSSPTPDPIPVDRIAWSGENNHVGRVDAAMEFMDRILGGSPVLTADSQPSLPPKRILVWAHSHGGNVMAIISGWLSATPEQRRSFFETLRCQYESNISHRIDQPKWTRVIERLCDPDFQPPQIDVVTFGMPIRYRWGHTISPIHLVHHHPRDPENRARAVLPTRIQNLIDADAGDYVQHLGIGGTDFTPSLLTWRDWNADRQIAKAIEPDARRRDLWARLQKGQRESPDGTTVLIDYPKDPDSIYRKLIGHGVYTHRLHLPFHWEITLQECYAG